MCRGLQRAQFVILMDRETAQLVQTADEMERTPEIMEKVFLFDVDGTLINTGGAGSRALVRAFRARYRVEDALKGLILDGKTDPSIIREILQLNLGVSHGPEEVQEIMESYLVFLEEEVRSSPNFRIMPGIEELLAELAVREDALVGLATGNIERGARIKLERAGIYPYFRLGGYGSESEERPELVKIAIRKAENHLGRSLAPEEVYIIGDTPLDILSGKAAQASTVAVATGRYSLDELRPHLPNYLLPNLADYPAFLAEVYRS